MYERFTDRARKVMQLANQEAMGLNHSFIGTEHILMGLIKEGSGTGIETLKRLGVNLLKLRGDIRRVVQRGAAIVEVNAKLTQTPRGRQVIEYAMEECRTLKHNCVGTEHLLLGLLRETSGVAAQVLMDQRLKLEEVRAELVKLLGERPAPPPPPSKAIDDLPAGLKPIAAVLETEIQRLTTAKEKAVDSREFENAAALRDKAQTLMARKKSLLPEWIASRHREDPWLSTIDIATIELARRLSKERCWGLLPDLADALELAGCTDAELLDHCRRPGEHSGHCWVVDLLLARS